MTEAGEAGSPPDEDEFEVVLFGPGYGESIVLHIGSGCWVIVDSCINDEGNPRALEYLESIGVDPAQAVDLVVATHWHDDHICGMTRLVEVCSKANFCCANALLNKEFLTAVDALEGRHLSESGSGVREIHRVFTSLESKASCPTFATANRVIHARGKCEIRSLSPSDAVFRNFLQSIGNLFPSENRTKTRISSVTPNDTSVVLWIGIDDIAVLLGSDLEKRGWVEILQSGKWPTGKASVFKVPHHGSKSAYEPDVWNRMLESNPVAVLAPWRKGGRVLPSQCDVRRILAHTTNAYATASTGLSAPSQVRRHSMVDRTIRSTGIGLRQLVMSPGAIRLRRPLGSRGGWKIEIFGSACKL
ncbi:MAG: MBL fold metallo-hydrolase [Gemmatimonadota bacterium]|nr:MBL fold metallo-hydrolase [Gemmatimonadota bacterium]